MCEDLWSMSTVGQVRMELRRYLRLLRGQQYRRDVFWTFGRELGTTGDAAGEQAARRVG